MDLDKTLAERVAEREEKRRRQEQQRQLQEQMMQEQLGQNVLPQQVTDWRDWKSVCSKFDHVDIAIEMHGLIAGATINFVYTLFYI